MELYEKISFLRKTVGMSQQDLADKIDISRQSIYKWEQGLTSPDISKLVEIAKIFNITTDLLLDDKVGEKELTDYILNNKKEKKNVETNHKKSMLDYLLLVPILLGVGILIFMFYCFGIMIIGFLYAFFAGAIIAPLYGFVMIFVNASGGIGTILMCIAIICLGLGLIYPTFLLARWYKIKYLKLAKDVTNKIKNIDWKKVF